MVWLAGSLEASLEPSRSAIAGAAISSITSVDATAIVHGRRCTNALQRSHMPPRAGRADRAGRSAGARFARAGSCDAAARPGAGDRQQRRQQRQRGEHHQQHADRGRDRHAVEEFDAQQHHPQQRDHDGGAREQDRAPGGVHRLHDRLARVPERRTGGAVGLAEARQDEQRVVDAHAQPDHRRELGGEVGRVHHVGEQRDRPEAGAEAEQRGDDRQAHRGQRAERQQQHDDRRQQARPRWRRRSLPARSPRSPARRARPAGPAGRAARAT